MSAKTIQIEEIQARDLAGIVSVRNKLKYITDYADFEDTEIPSTRVVLEWINNSADLPAAVIDIAAGTPLTSYPDGLFYVINYNADYIPYGDYPEIQIYRLSGPYLIRRYTEYFFNPNGFLLVPIDDNDGTNTTYPYKIIIKK